MGNLSFARQRQRPLGWVGIGDGRLPMRWHNGCGTMAVDMQRRQRNASGRTPIAGSHDFPQRWPPIPSPARSRFPRFPTTPRLPHALSPAPAPAPSRTPELSASAPSALGRNNEQRRDTHSHCSN